MEYFKHEYTIQTDVSATAQVLCMRCGTLVQDMGYIEMPNKHDPSKIVCAVYPRPHSHMRQVPVLLERRGRLSMAHLMVCADCEKFELTDAVKPLILKQISTAEVVGLLWAKYPPAAADAARKRWEQTAIVRRLFGGELEAAYEGRIRKEAT